MPPLLCHLFDESAFEFSDPTGPSFDGFFDTQPPTTSVVPGTTPRTSSTTSTNQTHQHDGGLAAPPAVPQRSAMRRTVIVVDEDDEILRQRSFDSAKEAARAIVSNTPRRTTRNVTFAAYDRIYDIIHKNDLTDEERKKVWITGTELQNNLNEFHRIRQHLKKEHQQVEESKGVGGSTTTAANALNNTTISSSFLFTLSGNDEFCLRGLEMLFPAIQKERKLLKNISRDTVFREQAYQYNQQGFINEDEKLAFLYSTSTIKAVEVARWRGSEDANCVY